MQFRATEVPREARRLWCSPLKRRGSDACRFPSQRRVVVRPVWASWDRDLPGRGWGRIANFDQGAR
eukprot:10330385-Alexandrium_andersonii.AAC.1